VKKSDFQGNSGFRRLRQKPQKIKNGGCNASVIQRPKALVEPLDGSKFWRNLLRLNKYRSR
jgi:hypothetical protein